MIQSLFELDATNTTTGQGITTFNAPVTLAIVVAPGTLSLAGGNLANVQVFRFNENTRAWAQVACGVGLTGLSCSTAGFSLWALVVATQIAAAPGQQVPGQQLPGGGVVPSAPRPAATGMGRSDGSPSILPMAVLVLVAGGFAGTGAYAVRALPPVASGLSRGGWSRRRR